MKNHVALTEEEIAKLLLGEHTQLRVNWNDLHDVTFLGRGAFGDVREGERLRDTVSFSDNTLGLQSESLHYGKTSCH